LRDNDAIPILGIPEIVVLETVDVDVQAIGVDIHIGHELA
jgi:hypothetical protein